MLVVIYVLGSTSICVVAWISRLSSAYKSAISRGESATNEYLHTLTLFFTSRIVGGFPFLAASATGSSTDNFTRSSAMLIIGTFMRVPGIV